MNLKSWLVVVIMAICQERAIAQLWEPSDEEKGALQAVAVCYSIAGPGFLRLDMCSDHEGEFDRLDVIAMRDEKGRPNLPYRVRAFKGSTVREIALIPHDHCEGGTAVERLFVGQEPMIGTDELGIAGNESKAVDDGIVHIEGTNGLRNVVLTAPSRFEEMVVYDVKQEACNYNITGLGTRAMARWHLFDMGLSLSHMNCAVMESTARRFPFLPSQNYVCAWALYQSQESKSGWEKGLSGKENRFVLNVRIWKAEDELTRGNVLCVARVLGCLKTAGDDIVKMEFEKGEGSLRVTVENGPLGETSRIMRLRFKGLMTSVHFPPDALTRELDMRIEGLGRVKAH